MGYDAILKEVYGIDSEASMQGKLTVDPDVAEVVQEIIYNNGGSVDSANPQDNGVAIYFRL